MYINHVSEGFFLLLFFLMKPTATPLALKRPSLLLLPCPLPSSLLHLENCLLWGVLPFSLLHFVLFSC